MCNIILVNSFFHCIVLLHCAEVEEESGAAVQSLQNRTVEDSEYAPADTACGKIKLCTAVRHENTNIHNKGLTCSTRTVVL